MHYLNSTNSYQLTEMVFTVTTILDIICTITFFFAKKSCKLCTEKKEKINQKLETENAEATKTLTQVIYGKWY